jgi:hypothetical protein
MRNFYVADILDAMLTENPESDRSGRAGLLVRRLGEGDFFRNDLSTFRSVVKGKKIFSFYETEMTSVLTKNSGQVRRDGQGVMAAAPNSVVLGWDDEEAIPADKDHSDIVKFELRSDQTYQDIKHRIEKVLLELGTGL